MAWQSTADAHAYWRAYHQDNQPPSLFYEAEVFVLSRRPQCTDDAICILEVICANGGDNRVDGLDVAGLQRVKEFLLRGRN